MPWHTHEIGNQVPDLRDYNLFTTDITLKEGVERANAGWHEASLSALGAMLGTEEVFHLGDLANRHPPELFTHDRQGRRIDFLEFHPGWHRLLASLRHEGLHAMPWMQPRPGAHVARAAGYYLHGQIEAGSLCPTTMTFASIPVLQKEPALFASLREKLFSCEHDERDLPIGQKRSILVGMGMTEKQGGSDVRTNSTIARPVSGQGRGAEYALTGHKWFFSAPMSDAHLVLARTDAGLSCFFVPRWRPDGSKNSVLIQRLKDKLGNRSNSSSEVEFQDAYGVMVGEEGRGIPTIIEMASYTRLDCVIGSASLMRQALVQALHHARHRVAFSKPLAEQPLMRNVLCDLALESEAATLLMLRLAQAFDAPDDPLERAWRRIVTPAAKFWVCKRAVEFSGECMEIWGGNGYVETGPMARIYREAPVNSIWEGSGNVMCLDVLRAIEREPDAFSLLMDDIERTAAGHAHLKNLILGLRQTAQAPGALQEKSARHFSQRLVIALQSGLMLAYSSAYAAEIFIDSRTSADCGRIYGCLEQAGSVQDNEILNRAWPS